MMSKDRVRFFMTDNDDNKHGTLHAAGRAFSTTRYLWHKTIVCRPSQFARFLIYRSERVGNNRFVQFGAELFTPKIEDRVVDVSKELAQ